MRYRAFKELVMAYKVKLPESGASILFLIEMPKSWSRKKREQMDGQPHTQRPDIDNLLKALMDAIYGEDCGVWHLSGLSKRWSYYGAIVIV